MDDIGWLYQAVGDYKKARVDEVAALEMTIIELENQIAELHDELKQAGVEVT